MSECICQIQGLGQWLKDWQTLISGLLALGAAVWAGSLLRSQIAQAGKLHRKDIERSHNAARVALPMALSEVSQYVQKIADNVAEELEKYQEDSAKVPREELAHSGAEVDPIPVVDLPKDVIPLFQSFVQTLTDEADIRHIAELLSSIQILHARYSKLDFQQVAMRMTLFGRLLDAAKVAYLNDKIFNYGRYLEAEHFGVVGVVDQNEAWDAIHGKALGLLFSRRSPDFFFRELKERVDGYKRMNLSPWLEKMDG